MDFNNVDEALKRRYEGDDPAVIDFENCAQAILPVDDAHVDELLKLDMGITIWTTSLLGFGVAGQNSMCGIINPADSNTVVRVTKAWARGGTASTHYFDVLIKDAEDPVTFWNTVAYDDGAPRDSRLGPLALPQVFGGVRHSAVNPGGRRLTRMPGGNSVGTGPFTTPDTVFPLLLWPGSMLYFRTIVVNQICGMNLSWEERPIRQTEIA